MINKIYVFLIIIMISSLSFKITEKAENKIVISDSNTELNISEFNLDDGIIELKSDRNFKLFVKISSNKTNGKNKDSWIISKKKGIRYKVKYVYQYLPSNKRINDIQDFIIWNDGEVDNWKNSKRVSVENISFKTNIH